MKNFTTKSAFLKSTCQNVKTLKVDELMIKKVNCGIFCDFTTLLNNETNNKNTNGVYQFPVAKIDELGVVKIYQNLSDNTILTSQRLKQWYEDGVNIFFSYSGGETSIKNIEQLKNGKYIFREASITTFDKQLTSLEMGNFMFYHCKLLTSFNSSLNSLTNGYYMFNGCSSLKSFNSSLNSLTNGYYMFYGCSSLKSFNTSLNSLTDGRYMFYLCSSLTSFDSSLSSLSDGDYMFSYCSSLTSFDSSLSSLSDAGYMFQSCSSLTSFNSSLSSLIDGVCMFQRCSSLTSFNGSLSSLIYGNSMFDKCKLDLASVQNIASTINDLASQSKKGNMVIGINSSIKGNSSLTTALTTIRNKGWTVTEQYN